MSAPSKNLPTAQPKKSTSTPVAPVKNAGVQKHRHGSTRIVSPTNMKNALKAAIRRHASAHTGGLPVPKIGIGRAVKVLETALTALFRQEVKNAYLRRMTMAQNGRSLVLSLWGPSLLPGQPLFQLAPAACRPALETIVNHRNYTPPKEKAVDAAAATQPKSGKQKKLPAPSN